MIWSNCCAVNADRCYNSVYNCVCLRLKLCLPFSETSLFKDIGTLITWITGIWKTHKNSHCVAVTACKSSHGQEIYLRVLNVFLLTKNIAKIKNLLFLKRTLWLVEILKKTQGY